VKLAKTQAPTVGVTCLAEAKALRAEAIAARARADALDARAELREREASIVDEQARADASGGALVGREDVGLTLDEWKSATKGLHRYRVGRRLLVYREAFERAVAAKRVDDAAKKVAPLASAPSDELDALLANAMRKRSA
jgi:hypothetical protein